MTTAADFPVPLVPASMLGAFVYCPRLAFLQWVNSEWQDSADTVEGTLRHRRVDRPGYRHRPAQADSCARETASGEADGDSPQQIEQRRSVSLSDPDLGLVARIDLVESDGECVEPIEFKKGKRPHTDQGAWNPERVQVCAQGLLLRANGYRCEKGAIYFAGSHERVAVQFDDELVALTQAKLAELRQCAESGALPSPLEDSPRCPRCSLVGICLPDETRWLTRGDKPPRRLCPSLSDRHPVYVLSPRARVHKNGALLEVRAEKEKIGEARFEETSALVIFGRAQVTTAVIHECCKRGIPISFLSSGGWLSGILQGLPHKNIELRRAQFAVAMDPRRALSIACGVVQAKIANMRTLLRRNTERGSLDRVLVDLNAHRRAAIRAASPSALMGHEGAATRLYFQHFSRMLKGDPDLLANFSFEGRNRRPPRDRMNAMLSFGYSVLAREFTQTIAMVGLDPYQGYLHAPRYGRPALALDLMEPFRPLVADSVCMTLVNSRGIKAGDFVEAMGSVNLDRSGRSKFLAALEHRLEQEVVHPLLGYKVSYRRIFETETRLLGRHLTGEIDRYRPLTTR